MNCGSVWSWPRKLCGVLSFSPSLLPPSLEPARRCMPGCPPASCEKQVEKPVVRSKMKKKMKWCHMMSHYVTLHLIVRAFSALVNLHDLQNFDSAARVTTGQSMMSMSCHIIFCSKEKHRRHKPRRFLDLLVSYILCSFSPNGRLPLLGEAAHRS